MKDSQLYLLLAVIASCCSFLTNNNFDRLCLIIIATYFGFITVLMAILKDNN
jgi:hypothetical protein